MRPGGSSRHWRRTRELTLARDGWRCRAADVRYRGYLPHLAPWRATLVVSPDCSGGDRDRLDCHHVRGVRETGDDPRYLLTLCRACNLATGDPRRADARPSAVTGW